MASSSHSLPAVSLASRPPHKTSPPPPPRQPVDCLGNPHSLHRAVCLVSLGPVIQRLLLPQREDSLDSSLRRAGVLLADCSGNLQQPRPQEDYLDSQRPKHRLRPLLLPAVFLAPNLRQRRRHRADFSDSQPRPRPQADYSASRQQARPPQRPQAVSSARSPVSQPAAWWAHLLAQRYLAVVFSALKTRQPLDRRLALRAYSVPPQQLRRLLPLECPRASKCLHRRHLPKCTRTRTLSGTTSSSASLQPWKTSRKSSTS